MEDYIPPDYSEFVPIRGYPGYTCNRNGEVRGQPSKPNPMGKLLKPSLGGRIGKQRLKMQLCKDNVAETVKVHTIIGSTFLGAKPSPKHSIDHINCAEPWNNNIDNLRWASPELQGANTPMQLDNTSGARGLTKHKKKGWAWMIRCEHVTYRGYKVNKLDAYNALKDKRIELNLSIESHIFGKYIPEEPETNVIQ